MIKLTEEFVKKKEPKNIKTQKRVYGMLTG